jgi:hypothetical protein
MGGISKYFVSGRALPAAVLICVSVLASGCGGGDSETPLPDRYPTSVIQGSTLLTGSSSAYLDASLQQGQDTCRRNLVLLISLVGEPLILGDTSVQRVEFWRDGLMILNESLPSSGLKRISPKLIQSDPILLCRGMVNVGDRIVIVQQLSIGAALRTPEVTISAIE